MRLAEGVEQKLVCKSSATSSRNLMCRETIIAGRATQGTFNLIWLAALRVRGMWRVLIDDCARDPIDRRVPVALKIFYSLK